MQTTVIDASILLSDLNVNLNVTYLVVATAKDNGMHHKVNSSAVSYVTPVHQKTETIQHVCKSIKQNLDFWLTCLIHSLTYYKTFNTLIPC